ncbi:21527_t:CDS:2 [Gigaspora margarita]|uniref:21527_t:CDS:1 n=1 Tax=Gigaspora margarita TaxID=4874 RepID=A0ABN7UGS6_GIGMA|nr:21527_t:CDS:2 [Gigaspora margarita]
MNQSFQDVSTKTKNKTARAARPMREIPAELDLNNIYSPKYHITELISTKSRSRTLDDTHIRRPPNGFFLMKNCYMLELRKLGFRYTMPEICRHSKKIWSELPQHAKKTYERLSLESQVVHQEKFPNFKFNPKRNRLKSCTPKNGDPIHKNTSAFSATNILGTKLHFSDKDSCLSNSPPSSGTDILDSLLPSESEIFDTFNLLSDQDSRLSNYLLSPESEICSSPANSLDFDAFLMNPSLKDFSSSESFSSPEIFSPDLSTSFESQFGLNGLESSKLSLNESGLSESGLNELGIGYPIMGVLEDLQTLPNYLNIPNDIFANNYYVYNSFPFIIEDNGLQQGFVGFDSVSNYVSNI